MQGWDMGSEDHLINIEHSLLYRDFVQIKWFRLDK